MMLSLRFIVFAVKTFIKQSLCDHHWHWWRNIYGDEINQGGARTVWLCDKCDKFKYDQDYYTKDMAISIHKDSPK